MFCNSCKLTTFVKDENNNSKTVKHCGSCGNFIFQSFEKYNYAQNVAINTSYVPTPVSTPVPTTTTTVSSNTNKTFGLMSTLLENANNYCTSLIKPSKTSNTSSLTSASSTTQNVKKVYIMGNLGDPEKTKFDSLANKLGSTRDYPPHVTLFEIIINEEHPKAYKLGNDFFQNVTKRISLPNITLKHDKFDIKGQSSKKMFFTASYKIKRESCKNEITSFRELIYLAIETQVNGIVKKIKNDEKYVYYALDGEILYAVPKYSHGKGTWTPHVSILRSYACTSLCRQALETNDVNSVIRHMNVQTDRIQYVNVRNCSLSCSVSSVSIDNSNNNISF